MSKKYVPGAGLASLTDTAPTTQDRQKYAANTLAPFYQSIKRYPSLLRAFDNGRSWSEFVTNPTNTCAIRQAKTLPPYLALPEILRPFFGRTALPNVQKIRTYTPAEYDRLTNYLIDGSRTVGQATDLWLPTTAKSISTVSPEAFLGSSRTFRDTLGDFDSWSKQIRLLRDLSPEKYVRTLGHELGHSQQGLSLSYPTRVGGMSNAALTRLSRHAGLGELIAHNNAIRNLTAARQIASQQGDRQAADLFNRQIRQVFLESTGRNSYTPYVWDSTFTDQIKTLRNAAKEDTAQYLGMLSYLDDNAKKLLPGLSHDFTERMPTAVFPDGIPVVPGLTNAYKSFLRKANGAGIHAVYGR